MARRSSFNGVINAIVRGVARSQRMAEAARKGAIRAAQRAAIANAKEGKLKYLESRIEEVADLNSHLEEQLAEYSTILQQTVTIDDTIDFDSLRIKDIFPPFVVPKDLSIAANQPLEQSYFNTVAKPSIFAKLIPGWAKRYEKAIALAKAQFQSDHDKWQAYELKRVGQIDILKKDYDDSLESFNLKVRNRDNEVDELKRTYFAADPSAVATYNNMVLERSSYPENFPQEFRLAYVPESKELVIDYELPQPSIVPKVEEYRYVKSKDQIEEKPRKVTSSKEIYQDIVAAITLRTCHEVLEADQANLIEVVVFNGFVQTVNAATGKDIKPYLVSVRVTKDRFKEIDLSRIDMSICLRNLGAQVSPRPHEIQPVKPIIEFDMVDKRFVEQSDILADLDARPNLMDLNPFEFENLVANLFSQLGLETKLTRSSRDGGVDAVAYDARPVLGGKVVIQAKRYKNTVGVSAVRDLYGTMLNEGANKGILVATSGYGPDAFEFAKDKPIELMDGGQLLFLLDQVGVKARIIFPDEGGTASA